MAEQYRILSKDEARQYYDRAVQKQDQQAFYEDEPIAWLTETGDLKSAQSVFEFGCGTGRIAQQLLTDTLPKTATYQGYDLSPAMVQRAKTRLEPFGNRAQVALTQGETRFDLEEGSCDRFFSTYVFDLLSLSEIESLMAEAHRVLVPGGLLCLAGITSGPTLGSKIVMGIWHTAHRVKPTLVGGCRPLNTLDHLPADQWEHIQRSVFLARGIASEAIVVRKKA